MDVKNLFCKEILAINVLAVGCVFEMKRKSQKIFEL